MQSVTRILVMALLALLVALPGGTAAMAAEPAGPAVTAGAQQPTVDPPPTAPPGPTLTPEQESAKSRQKLVIGIIAVILLAIVIVGRSARNKARKKASG
jgi:hypothetical protein